MTVPLDTYKEHLHRYTQELNSVKKTINVISNQRLAVVVVVVTIAVLLFRLPNYPAMGAVLLVGLVLFLLLAIKHTRFFINRDNSSALVAINQKGVDRCAGRWDHFQDIGEEFCNDDHPYSSDLDLFGYHSLFQYICAAHTHFGRNKLAEQLQKPERKTSAIKARQEAVQWLAIRFAWRQMLECYGFAPAVGKNPESLLTWAENSEYFFTRIWVIRGLFFILPLATVANVITAFFVRPCIIPAVVLVGVQLLLTALFARKNLKQFDVFDKYAKVLSAYSDLLAHIEKQQFEPIALSTLQLAIASGKKGGASAALKRIAAAVSAAEARFSPLPWLLANVLWLWDIRCAIRMELWKKKYGRMVRTWLHCIGEFEALSSFALLRFEHPEWVFPEIDEEDLCVAADGIGHPLLFRKQCVENDIALGPPGGSVTIITGSNMSGKSTLLRTMGINLVLAYAGAPVYAKKLSCPVMAVYTSMRTGDDLHANRSTFYAELLRVKMIVDAVGEEYPLLFLLDELFRGTNSADRHDGAVALLKALSKPHTLGMISTHDLALCSLADGNSLFTNVHFEEFYDEEGLHFDYRIKPGPSTTRNALYLMRMVGIE